MTTAVRELLDSFDALSDTEKHEAYAYLLQRMLQASSGDVPEAKLQRRLGSLAVAQMTQVEDAVRRWLDL
jgi:hypothetical protein